jgi:hypothetical protein
MQRRMRLRERWSGGMDRRTGSGRRLGRALGLVVALAAVALPAAAVADGWGAGGGAVSPGRQPLGPINTCFWGEPQTNVGRIDRINETPPNIAGPDTNVAYYYTRFQLPAGATVTLHGEFPHARFTSLTTYVTVGGVPGIASTSLYDAQIAADPGSVNPFLPGAPRFLDKRAYTVTISGQVPPAVPAANTLYAGQAGTTGSTQQVELILRIYRPDRGDDAAGGVPLPDPTLTLGDGTKSTGRAACTALADVSGATAIPTAGQGVPPATYQALRGLAPAPHPATNPIVWYRFFNQARLAEPFYAGTPLAGKIASLPTAIMPSLYATPANAYILAYADRTIGPNPNGHNILVLHAKMPTHPSTYDHDPFNSSATPQVRYWSLCNYGSLANPPLVPANSSCLFDESVPTNASGYYTIVVSLPQDRPSNARPRCGVAWMDWGTAGDGQGRPTLDLLTMRNQLASPTFAQGIDKITVPDTEQQVMGAYYPTGAYMTTQQFEARGCAEDHR